MHTARYILGTMGMNIFDRSCPAQLVTILNSIALLGCADDFRVKLKAGKLEC